MKVNISGKGVIPGVGSLAPVSNVELTEKEIRRILSFKFNVYSSASGKRISVENIASIIKESATPTAPVVDKTVKKQKAEKKETYVAPVVEPVVDMVTPIEDKAVETIVTPIEEVVDIVSPIVEPIADAVEPIDIDDDSFSDKDDFDYNATDVVDVVEETTSYPKKNKKNKRK